MIERDRRMLVALQRFNSWGLPQSVLAIVDALEDGLLPPVGLRAIAEQFDRLADELRQLAEQNEADAQPDAPTGLAVRGIQERPGTSSGETRGENRKPPGRSPLTK